MEVERVQPDDEQCEKDEEFGKTVYIFIENQKYQYPDHLQNSRGFRLSDASVSKRSNFTPRLARLIFFCTIICWTLS